jgi:hypothetical protein
VSLIDSKRLSVTINPGAAAKISEPNRGMLLYIFGI